MYISNLIEILQDMIRHEDDRLITAEELSDMVSDDEDEVVE